MFLFFVGVCVPGSLGSGSSFCTFAATNTLLIYMHVYDAIKKKERKKAHL